MTIAVLKLFARQGSVTDGEMWQSCILWGILLVQMRLWSYINPFPNP